jgi:predicted esterase
VLAGLTGGCRTRAQATSAGDAAATPISTDAATPPASTDATAAPVASGSSPGPPKRVRRDSVRIAIEADASGAGWVMHESAPLVVPDDEPRPVTVLLHPLCADDNWTCDWLQYFEMAPQWQLCPRAPVACGGGGYEWTASAAETRRLVEQAVATAKANHGVRIRDDAIVLAGFSQGAYAVAAVVHDLARQPAPALKVKGILVQGGRVHFAAADLRRLGARIALAAGERDPAATAMRVEAMDLQRAGVDARYVSLGKDEGHFIAVSTGKMIAELIDWCRGD